MGPRHIALIYGVTGQEVEFYPPASQVVQDGAPAAATYSVWRGTQGNDDTALFSGTATLDSVSTTLSSAAGYSQANRRAIALTSSSGAAIGRWYAVTNAAGQREAVQLATVAQLVDDLAYDYAAADTVRGLRHVATVDATFIAASANINVSGAQSLLHRHQGAGDKIAAPPYRVRWTYTLAGLTRHYWTGFDVVRAPAQHGVSVADLRGIFPDISDHEWRQTRGQHFQAQIEEAWDRFKIDARVSGYDPSSFRDPQLVARLVKLAAIWGLALSGVVPGGWSKAEYVPIAQREYESLFARAIGTALNAWVDTATVGAINPTPPRQLWFVR